MEALRGHTSGLAIPHFVIDAPGGGGKIPVLPQYVLHRDDDRIVMRNYKNEVYVYRESKKQKTNGKAESMNIPIEIADKKNGHGNGNGNGNGNGSSKKPKNYKNITTIDVPELQTSSN